MGTKIKVRKANGKWEAFDLNRIKKTCYKAGVSKKVADSIAKKVSQQVYNGISTRKILKKIQNYLKEYKSSAAAIYSLKSALMRLGPSGFVFEDYITRLFRACGWQATNPEPILGFCISHEVDIILNKKGDYYPVECKYHNKRGIYSGSKDVLYTWGRFLDLKKGAQFKKNFFNFKKPLLVTNTKFSEQAKQFACCQQIELLGWNYPRKSLNFYIHKTKLWPITIIPNLNYNLRFKLFREKIICLEDLFSYDFKLKYTGISYQTIKSLQRQANEILTAYK